jgi:hypothetical protein
MSGKLKAYDVLLTREATESCAVRVKARSPREAEKKAMEKAGAYGENVDGWETDEGNLHKVYLPDPGNSSEEVTNV